MPELNQGAENAFKEGGRYMISASIRATKFTIKEFKAVVVGICKILTENAELGRQSLKSLTAKGTKIEELGADTSGEGLQWNKGMIKGFEKYADKYGINYSVLKDTGKDKDSKVKATEYHVFFEGKDISVVNRCLQEYIKEQLQKKEKVSLTEKLKFFRGRSRDMDLDHKKERGDKLKEKMPEHENR